ncbi:winged helix-turn-helix domain-containing protein [Streptosporangium amethystogenes subsp. fukuiense]|uniref:Winged helix-turn-helix domain-containing protein n=1 Tax=Streptosporangium amethystogenes subsp. fukuiense TaxID=698418 RepID=A0ABW2TAF6_9ACTN
MGGPQEPAPQWRQDRARWKQAYDILRGQLERGEYKTGFPIPSLAQLEQQFPDLARNTIRKAVDRLEREGFVRAEVGVGTFVRPSDEWEPTGD